jgi:hypothetical protein
MSDENPAPHETAYRAVVAYQEAKAQAKSRHHSIDVSNNRKTSMMVFGVFFGLILTAFKVDPKAPLTFLTPLAGMVIGGLIGWTIGRLRKLIFGTTMAKTRDGRD